MSSQPDIQEKIAAARREAELLKEKIRARREQLADTSRKSTGAVVPPASDPCRRQRALTPTPPHRDRDQCAPWQTTWSRSLGYRCACDEL